MLRVSNRQADPPKFVLLMDRVTAILTTVCGAALGLMVLSVAIGVLARFVFTHTSYRISVPWTEEVSRYLMIWTVFLGGAVAARSGKLIGVEFVVQALPALPGRVVKYAALVLSIMFYALMCLVGWKWVEFGLSQTSPVLEVPMTVINLAMLVGGFVMALNTVALILDSRHSGKDIRNATEDDELQAALEQFKPKPSMDGANTAIHAQNLNTGSLA